MISVAPAFAMDNDTVVAVENTTQLQATYYFDANIDDDSGNGSYYNPYKELDSSRIADNSIVHLANGEYALKGSRTYGNLTIIGKNPQNTIIKYDNAVGFTSKGLITFKNVTLLNLRVNLNKNANLTAINTIFKGNSATNSAIYSTNRELSGNTVILDNCSFIDNSARYGGAINLVGGILNITDSLFINNHADNYGGAIACDVVEVYMLNSKFIDNYASDDAGGAFYLLDSLLEANNSEFINCSSLFGGAICSLGSDLVLNNVVATNNKAKYYGGAIYKMYTYFNLYESQFENNSALNGGALFVDVVDDFKINSNYFANNDASSTGGAIYSVLSDSYYDIVDEHLNNTFRDNKANSYDDVYQSEFANMDIGNNDYILIHYNSSFNGTLPSRYDLRELGFVTPAKNQGNGGNCWAFSALSALESAILKATNVSYDLSEENMKNLASFYSDYGWAMETNEGGYDRMAIGYLTSWLGPINESYDAYCESSVLSAVFNSSIHIQNVLYLKRDNFTDNDAIKKAIMDYGAVSTSIYWSSSNLKNSKNYYYTGSSSANHAVAIVGWDDNYAASNFRTTPQGNGAWIIKNSWGSSGENGFYYVSYYDTKIADSGRYVTYAFVLNDTIKYDKNYQYDIPGRTDYFLNTSSTVWYKNKFTASDDEYLAAVSTYFEKDTDWSLYVYVNNVLKVTQSGFSNPGYKTIDLSSLIPLEVDDIFEVVFKITVDKDAGVPISEAISLNIEMYDENLSFISYDGKNWVDFYGLEWTYPDHRYDSQVACIKAFTVLNPVNSIIKLTPINIKNNALDIIANVFDEYGNLIRYGNVTFNVDGVDKVVAVSKGVAVLSNINIRIGINKFTAKFSAVGYNDSSDMLLVSGYPINTSISLDVLSQHNPFALKATVVDQNNNPVENGEVTFNVDGRDYVIGLCNGVASLNHTFKTSGLKNISARYNGFYCYKESSVNKSIPVFYIPTLINLSVDSQFNPINITAHVTDSNGNNVNQGHVIFNVDGNPYSVDVKDGFARLIQTLDLGSTSIQAEYHDEDYIYNQSNSKISFVVSLKPTVIHLNINEGDIVNNPVDIVATITDSDNNAVTIGKAVFSFDDEIFVLPVHNGKASLSHIFKCMGSNGISVRFIEGNYYDTSSCAVTFNVTKINVDLSVNIKRNIRDADVYLKFSKKINEYVSVLVNNDSYMVKTNDGEAVIRLSNLSNGEYIVNASVNSYIYDCNDESVGFTVKDIPSNICCDDEVFYWNKNMQYSVILKDQTGIPISNHEVWLTVGNKRINANTDSQGKALFKLDLNVGKYNAFIEFDGDNYYLKSNATKTITVKSTIELPTITRYTLNAKYCFKLLDINGNPLIDKQVEITINSEGHTLYTDKNGDVYYTIGLGVGSYQINITNPVTGEIKYQTIDVIQRIAKNKDLVMYYGAGSYYKVRVYDDNGNIARNVKVKFTIDGITYSRYSDSNGYAFIKIQLNPNTYVIQAKYMGYKVKNKIVVKPTLILNYAVVKKYSAFNYGVKLLDNNGKVLKYKYVKLTFRGNTYFAKTNYKGIAIFKLFSYAKGKFTVKAVYGTAIMYNKIKVK